jgi:hypothetical protein
MQQRAWDAPHLYSRRLLWAVLWSVFFRIVVPIGTAAADSSSPVLVVETPGVDHGAGDIAKVEAFVRNSATFRFDGIGGSLRLESVRPLAFCPGCYEYAVYFESQSPGYGDRSGVGITPGRTPHRAHIILVDHEVISGVLDHAWDIANHLIVDYECTFTP